LVAVRATTRAPKPNDRSRWQLALKGDARAQPIASGAGTSAAGAAEE
jgi:hypothetical protein